MFVLSDLVKNYHEVERKKLDSLALSNHVRWVPCHHSMARRQVADVRWVPCHHGMARPQVADVRWVPCHHSMARPQVADAASQEALSSISK
jgi:ribonuclease HI